MRRFEKYRHHGIDVSVMSKNKGKHRENCLCYSCEKFKPENRDENCKAANKLYAMALDNKNPIIVAPVWECAEFEEK